MSLLGANRPFIRSLQMASPGIRTGMLALIVVALGVALGAIMLSPARETAASAVIIGIYLIVIARNPLHGLLLWLVTQPLVDLFVNLSLGEGIPDLSATRFCIVFVTTLVLARTSVGRIRLAPFTKIDAIALVFLFGMTLSVPDALDGWRSFQSIFDQYFVPVLVYFLAKNLVQDKNQLRKVIDAAVLLAAYVGLYAIYEQTTGHVLIPVGETSEVFYVEGIRVLRGLLGHPHEFGRIIGIVVPFNFYLLLEEKRPGRRTLYIFTIIIMMIGLYLTYRRTAWIAALASLFIIQWFYPRFRRLFVVLLVLAVGMLYINRDSLEDSAVSTRIQQGDTTTLNGRTEGWEYAIELWQREPLTGHGYGQFSVIAKREGQRDTAIESQYYSILVSSGLLGFLPYAALLIAIPLSFAKTFRRAVRPDDRWLIVVFWGAHASYLVNAYTATLNQLVVTSLLFALAGALAVLHARPMTSVIETEPVGSAAAR